MVHAPWLDWTLPLLRHPEEYRDYVVLGEGGGGGGERYDLPGSVMSPVDAAFVW